MLVFTKVMAGGRAECKKKVNPTKIITLGIGFTRANLHPEVNYHRTPI